MACLIGIQTIALSCIEEIIKQEIKQGVQQGNFKSWLFSFSPSSLLSMVGAGWFNVSCKRRFVVCNHTRDKQIGLPLRGRPILLSLVWLQTELDSTQSYYHYLSPICVPEISLKVARNDVKRQN